MLLSLQTLQLWIIIKHILHWSETNELKLTTIFCMQGPREFVRNEIRSRFRARKNETDPVKIAQYIKEAEKQLRMIKLSHHRVFVSQSVTNNAPKYNQFLGNDVNPAHSHQSIASHPPTTTPVHTAHEPLTRTPFTQRPTPSSINHHQHAPVEPHAPSPAQIISARNIAMDGSSLAERKTASMHSGDLSKGATDATWTSTDSGVSQNYQKANAHFSSAPESSPQTPDVGSTLFSPAQLARQQLERSPWMNAIHHVSSNLRSSSKAHAPDDKLPDSYIQAMKKRNQST